MRGLTSRPVDLAVLDIKMPRMDGMELLQKLRQNSNMPVIFLTSKDDEVDEVLGLRIGRRRLHQEAVQAQRLLIERIRAILRRDQAARDPGPAATPEEEIRRGELLLDSNRHACLWKGKPIELTVTEFLLVKALALRPGHVKSRDQLMDAAYGEHILCR